MKLLRYGNTNTYYIEGRAGGLLVDTDYAGTLPQFFKAIKAAGIGLRESACLLVTHYHPDHSGLAGELQRLGVTLLLVDVQRAHVHFPDAIFAKDRRPAFRPVDESAAAVISCAGSRAFLRGLGINGEILRTPSHSPDSVSLLLDDGTCLVGDLEPQEYLGGYAHNDALEHDWEQILQRRPKRILYGHVNAREL